MRLPGLADRYRLEDVEPSHRDVEARLLRREEVWALSRVPETKGFPVTVNHPQFGLMCCVCFEGLTEENCAQDTDGVKWDVCKGKCATDTGIEEAS